jgi:hypothetical protein
VNEANRSIGTRTKEGLSSAAGQSLRAFTTLGTMTKIFSHGFMASAKEVAGVFKIGTGVLGKSAIAMGVLLIAVIVAVARLHSDSAIILAIVLGCLVFIAWFLFFLRFAGLHPELVLLEGAEGMGGKRFEANAKAFIPHPSEMTQNQSHGRTPPPGSGGPELLGERESERTGTDFQ